MAIRKVVAPKLNIKHNTGIRLFADQVERIDELLRGKYAGRLDRSTFVRNAIDEKIKRIDEGLE